MTFLAGQTLTAADLNNATAKGLITELVRTSSSGTFTTTETVLDYVTVTLVSTVTYELRCATPLQSSVASDIIDVRFRYLAGASLTISGTEFHHVTPNADIAGRGQLLATTRTITGLSGQYSLGITAVRNSGSGNISSVASSSQNSVLSLYRVGG